MRIRLTSQAIGVRIETLEQALLDAGDEWPTCKGLRLLP